MAGVKLRDYQYDAITRMKNGCVLNGDVGSGKSRTGLAYFYILHGGVVYYSKKDENGKYKDEYYIQESSELVKNPEYVFMKNPKDLYIITTARKRDSIEWEGELSIFLMSTDSKKNHYKNKIVVDSWNNIGKYKEVKDSFFIFDEQRLVGYGAWSKAFLKIAKRNNWILMSATPGDTWKDYLTVFIANGFFENKTEFYKKHVVLAGYLKYQKIDKYINVGKLMRLKADILVKMDYRNDVITNHEYVITKYDEDTYKFITKTRWNIFKKKPIENSGEYCMVLRQVVNSDFTRKKAVLDIVTKHKKCIIFYMFDFELEILRELFKNYPNAEWNGHKHQEIPTGDAWVYLVEYISASEAWNCVSTNVIIFYSDHYSYKIMHQSAGRINRMNTPYKELYYYHLRSNSAIDLRIRDSLRMKKKFNETDFAPKELFLKKQEKTETKPFNILDYVEVGYSDGDL